MTTDFDFAGAEGGQAAEEAAKSQGRGFNRTGYLRLDGSPQGMQSGANVCFLRFLSDHVRRPEGDERAHEPGSRYGVPWITVDMHSMVPTKAKPADWPADRGWPSSMSAVCRNDKVFAAKYGDCFIHANLKKTVKGKEVPFTASPRTWALAVLREEVVGDGSEALGGAAMKGQVLGMRDKTKEVSKVVDGKAVEGEVEIVPDIVIVCLAWKNFFGAVAGMAARYKTILDRDLFIERKGNDQSTIYQIVPMDPIHLGKDNKYGLPDGTKYDLSIPSLMKTVYPDLPDLREIVSEQASDDYYARFFDTTKVSPPLKKEGEEGAQTPQQAAAGPANTPAAPQTEAPSAEALAALRDRISGGGGAAASPPAAAEPATAGASTGGQAL